MPDLTHEEADRCPDCDDILRGYGPCVACQMKAEAEADPPEEGHMDAALREEGKWPR